MTNSVPAALETEADVLGICLEEGMSWWNMVQRQVQVDSIKDLFHDTDHRTVAIAFMRVEEDGGALTRATVLDALARDSGSENLAPDPDSYIDSLARRTTIRTLEDLTKSLNVLNAKAQLRSQLFAIEKLTEKIRAEEPHPNDVVSELKSVSLSSGMADGITAFSDIIARIEEENTREAAYRLKTNLPEFDAKIRGGIDPGRFMLIAARPSVGKTTHAMNIMIEALQQDYLVVFASLEIPQRELFVKMITAMSYADNNKVSEWSESSSITDGARHFDQQEWKDVQNAVASLQSAPFYSMFSGDVPFGVDSVISNTYKAMQQHPDKPVLLVVDFIQLLITQDQKIRGGDHGALTEISRKLKTFSMDANIVTIGISQMNREGAEHPPALHQLRGSGSLEENSDVVVLLDRPSQRDESVPPNLLHLNVAKSRLGSSFQMDALWMPEIQVVTSRSVLDGDAVQATTEETEAEDTSGEYFTATSKSKKSDAPIDDDAPKKRRRVSQKDEDGAKKESSPKRTKKQASTREESQQTVRRRAAKSDDSDAPKKERRRARRTADDDDEDFH